MSGPAPAPDLTDGEWTLYTDENTGYPYYYNHVTGESMWAESDDFKKASLLPHTSIPSSSSYNQEHESMRAYGNKDSEVGNGRLVDSSEEDDGDDDDDDDSDSDDSESDSEDTEFEEQFAAYMDTEAGQAALESEQEHVRLALEERVRKAEEQLKQEQERLRMYGTGQTGADAGIMSSMTSLLGYSREDDAYSLSKKGDGEYPTHDDDRLESRISPTHAMTPDLERLRQRYTNQTRDADDYPSAWGMNRGDRGKGGQTPIRDERLDRYESSSGRVFASGGGRSSFSRKESDEETADSMSTDDSDVQEALQPLMPPVATWGEYVRQYVPTALADAVNARLSESDSEVITVQHIWNAVWGISKDFTRWSLQAVYVQSQVLINVAEQQLGRVLHQLDDGLVALVDTNGSTESAGEELEQGGLAEANAAGDEFEEEVNENKTYDDMRGRVAVAGVGGDTPRSRLMKVQSAHSRVTEQSPGSKTISSKGGQVMNESFFETDNEDNDDRQEGEVFSPGMAETKTIVA